MTSTLERSSAGNIEPTTQSWAPPAQILARGVLIVVPGRGEHAGLYERFGRRISADGYVVHAVSEPTVDPAVTRAEIASLLSAERAGGPRVLVGSDSGAAFAVAVAAAGAVAVDALVLSGLPTVATGADEFGWEDELGARTACSAHRGRLTDDPGFRRGALTQPVPAEWLTPGLAVVTIPVLGLHGADDPVSPLDQVRQVYAQTAKAELVSIAGGLHDALNDQTHRTAAATIVLFLERLRLGADLAPIARTEQLS